MFIFKQQLDCSINIDLTLRQIKLLQNNDVLKSPDLLLLLVEGWQG